MVFRINQNNDENINDEPGQVNQPNLVNEEESKSEQQVYNQHREAPENHYLYNDNQVWDK